MHIPRVFVPGSRPWIPPPCIRPPTFFQTLDPTRQLDPLPSRLLYSSPLSDPVKWLLWQPDVATPLKVSVPSAKHSEFPPIAASARSTVSGGRKMGSRNGSNVRTMRTRFPRGRKGGEQQQENSLRLSLGLRSQGAHGFPAEAVERVLVGYEPSGFGWAAQPLARGRVSGAGCVPGTESRLGEQLFRSPLSLCKSRESGRG